MGKAKTKYRKSCPSHKAYAGGKKKGRCVPKKVKARGGKRGCFAKTRDAAIAKMELYKKTAIEREQKRAAASAAVAAADARAAAAAEGEGTVGWEESAAAHGWTGSRFGGLHRRRRRFRRR